jgi:hypothetical protein
MINVTCFIHYYIISRCKDILDDDDNDDNFNKKQILKVLVEHFQGYSDINKVSLWETIFFA